MTPTVILGGSFLRAYDVVFNQETLYVGMHPHYPDSVIDNGEPHLSNDWLIVIIVFSVLFAAVIINVLVCFFWKKKKKMSREEEDYESEYGRLPDTGINTGASFASERSDSRF